MGFVFQELLSYVNIFSVLAVIACSFSFSLVHNDYTMEDSTKKSLYLCSTCVAVLAVLDNVSYVLYYIEDSAFAIKMIYTVLFIIINLLPFVFLSMMKKSFFCSTKGIIVGAMVSANIITLLLNLNFPILFDITKSNGYVQNKFNWVRPTLIALTYFLVMADVFKQRYQMTRAEKNMANQIFGLFIAAFIFYDVFYVGEVISVFLGMGLMLLTAMFHGLELKTCSITGLLNNYVYKNDAVLMEHRKDLVVVSIDLNDLKKVNDTLSHDEGDKYIRANARTIADAIEPYGKLYRKGGDEFAFLGTNLIEVTRALSDLQKVTNTNPVYGKYNLSFSFGAVIKAKDETVFDAFNRADLMMYENKKFIKSRRVGECR